MVEAAVSGSAVGDCLQLADLQDPGYAFVDHDREIECLMDRLGIHVDGVISGAVVKQGDGVDGEIWVTESSRPFDLVASYTRLH